MGLSARIAQLAGRIGLELKSKVNASHPGVARAWVCFGYVGSKVLVRAAYGVSGVTRLGSGRYRVNFSPALPDANYCWLALARSNVDSGTQRLAIVRASTDLKTSQYVDIACATTAAGLADSAEINLVVYR